MLISWHRADFQVMLENNPELRNIFSIPAQNSGAQPAALAGSVLAYAQNIKDLSPLTPVVVRIAEKHAALGVKPEHYPVVGENLMGAIGHVLGDAFTPELQEAWYHAYWQLAKIFIDVEAGLYSKAAWQGWKDFEVRAVHAESPTITSFELVPKDKDMLPLKPYLPGQFITLRVHVPELGCYQNRHYSLSDSPSGDHYRVTIKREAGQDSNPDGIVSNIMHSLKAGDTVSAAFPAGSFVLPEKIPENVVLIAGGVGITPNLAMLNQLTSRPAESWPKITWVHGVRSAPEHVFRSHVAKLAEKSGGKLVQQAYYSNGDEGANTGRITVEKIKDTLPLADKDAVYYICGPGNFMTDIERDLIAAGVPKNKINIEAFHAGEA